MDLSVEEAGGASGNCSSHGGTSESQGTEGVFDEDDAEYAAGTLSWTKIRRVIASFDLQQDEAIQRASPPFPLLHL